MAVRARILVAARCLPRPDRLFEGGGVLVRAGCIERVLATPRAVARAARAADARVVDLGDVVLTPGLVNAHAHLELGALAGALPAGRGFGAWIGALLRARACLSPADFDAGVRSGARALLAGGATLVGDVDSSGASERVARGVALRRVVLREALDAWNPARTDASLTRCRRAFRRRARTLEGISPHAPYTTSAALLAGVRALARSRGLPVQVHWAETRDENAWLLHGTGPLADVLPASPQQSGLDLLENARLLGRRTSLVHANHPERGEAARIAASGATVVHCPGTHAWFGREPFDARRWRRAGVPLALGTDSLASNEALDVRREMALARSADTGLSPGAVWTMATLGGARALGLERRAGSLDRGRWGDVVAHAGIGSGGRAALLDALTSGAGHVTSVYVAGRRVHDLRIAGDSAVDSWATTPMTRPGRAGPGTAGPPKRP